MMTGAELQAFADEWGITPAAAALDHVTGWLAAGIAQHDRLGPAWTFAGGACLRKCYLETYRFSGELSYTATPAALTDAAVLRQALADVATWVTRRSGMVAPPDLVQFELGCNDHGDRVGTGYVSYRGPLTPASQPMPSLEDITRARARARRETEAHPNRHASATRPPGFAAGQDPQDGFRVDFGLPFITIRVLAADALELPRVARRLAHPYSDLPSGGFVIPCPALEELFCERLLTLVTHPRPGDLYDLAAMFRDEQTRPPMDLLRPLLARKTRAARLGTPGAWRLRTLEQELRECWQARLEPQLPVVPPFAHVWATVPAIEHWLETGEKPEGPRPIPLGDEFRPYSLPPDQPRPARLQRSGFVEIIRFAVLNRLVLEIDYENAAGEIKTRMVEPSALRASRRGDVLLMATHCDVKNLRSYRLDRTRAVRLTSTPFTGRYAGDLGPAIDPPLQFASLTASAGATSDAGR